MKIHSFIIQLFFIPIALYCQVTDSSYIRGVDISFTPQIEELGGKYKLNGVEKDVLDIFKENGVNYIRLRLWHTQSNGYCGTAKTIDFAKRIKAKGFKLLLDFHYSDWWADPGKQNKPAAWATLTFDVLKDSVYAYSKNVIEAFRDKNVLPDMVQIGNEITAGMLWPDGRIPTSNPTLAWQQFGELVKEGIRGVKDAAHDTSLKIMIHIDRGGDNNGAVWFFDNLIAQGVQFDVIGLSYYPWWHGSLTQVRDNLNDLSVRYNKEIVIAETAYPWTTQYLNDGMGNVGVNASKLPQGYAITPQGQKAFLFTLEKIIKETINDKGTGFFYWEPAYISVPPIGSAWENLTTFDFNGNALGTVTSFMDFDTMKSVNVKIRINTATNPDTLKPDGVVQIRGEIKGIGSGFLPSGELLTWDSYSQLLPANIGGDYWEYQFAMYPSDRFEYKLWTGHTKTRQTYWNLGSEGKIIPYDSSNLNLRLFVAGTSDTTLEMQYYSNSLTAPIDQYWSPFQTKQDSVGVLFRVNVADLTSKGLFDPNIHGTIVVQGDSVNPAGFLSSTDEVILNRESISVANGSFWSGVAYFPKNVVTDGTKIRYKYFIKNSLFGGNESNIDYRTFGFTGIDTTLAWQFFNNKVVPSDVEMQTQSIPKESRLNQNYPNPFNSSTTIRYSIAKRSHVMLSVYDLLGQMIAPLTDQIQNTGEYSRTWNAIDNTGVPIGSGVYFVKLTVEGIHHIQKMILLK